MTRGVGRPGGASRDHREPGTQSGPRSLAPAAGAKAGEIGPKDHRQTVGAWAVKNTTRQA